MNMFNLPWMRALDELNIRSNTPAIDALAEAVTEKCSKCGAEMIGGTPSQESEHPGICGVCAENGNDYSEDLRERYDHEDTDESDCELDRRYNEDVRESKL